MTSDKRTLASILFLAGGQYAMQAASSLNSSPWTSENFGADPEKAKSAREYLLHGIGVSTASALLAGYVAQNWWPILGALLINAYMWWIYNRALARGANAGTDGWANA